MKNAIAQWLQDQGHEVEEDFGTHDDRGIVVDGVGYGSAMVANSLPGVFAAIAEHHIRPLESD